MLFENVKTLLSKSMVILFLLSLFPSWGYGGATLTVGKGSATPGSTDVLVSVSLENQDTDVKGGASIEICDEGDYLTCSACEATDRTVDFSCNVNELGSSFNELEGCCRIALYSSGGDLIEIGEGAIFTVHYNVSSEAPFQECRELNVASASMLQGNGFPLEVLSESGEFCFPCTSHEQCDDGLYCNGEERCIGGVCIAGTDACPELLCDEQNDECIEEYPSTTTTSPADTTTTSPAGTTTTSPADTTTTTSSPGGGSITISPDVLSKSHWIPLPFLLMIEGNGTNFSAPNLFDPSSPASEVTFMPATALLWLPPLVTDAEHIWQLVLVMPSWLAGEENQPLNITVNTDGEVVSEGILIEQLAF